MDNRFRYGNVLFLCGTLLACGDGGRSDTAATAEIAGLDAANTPILERVAGNWQVRVWNLSGDTLPGFTLVASPDTTRWLLHLEDRADIPVRVIAASGDLFVVETRPYESVLRPGVQVVLHLESTVEGDQLRGHMLALYDVAGAGAVLRGRTEGTRVR
jgi:hypothetical protein